MQPESVHEDSIDLSIIIVAWNVKEMMDRCLTCLRKSKDTLNKQILFVDNASTDGTSEHVQAHFPEVEIIHSPVNLGFIRANNLAYEKAKGKYILMLNSDAFVFEETLQKTVAFMEATPEAGVLGTRLIGEDGVLQPSARCFPTPFKLFLRELGLDGKFPGVGPLDDLNCKHDSIRECDWVVGCFLLARKSAVDRLGFFLRDDYFLYNDDNDLCLRVKRDGWKIFFYPTDVIHIGGATTKKMGEKRRSREVERFHIESELIYFRKNYGWGSAVSYCLSGLVVNVLRAVKSGLHRKSWHRVSEFSGRISLIMRTLIETRLGCRPCTQVPSNES